MLTSQFVAVAKGQSDGIIDRYCDPVPVIWRAAQDAEQLCHAHYKTIPPIHIQRSPSTNKFAYIPHYLYYILFEIFKNSIRAQIEKNIKNAEHNADALKEGVEVVVSGDENTCVVRISDKGGGLSHTAPIWSYMYSTAVSEDKNEEYVGLEAGATGGAAVGSKESQPSPLAGFGCGLPLSRIYARYLGGDLQVMSIPNWGVDAYVMLNRLNVKELVPPGWVVSSLEPDSASPPVKSTAKDDHPTLCKVEIEETGEEPSVLVEVEGGKTQQLLASVNQVFRVNGWTIGHATISKLENKTINTFKLKKIDNSSASENSLQKVKETLKSWLKH
eukprot:Platyproteum_vivax@DN6266_c0_g1_i4.p1